MSTSKTGCSHQAISLAKKLETIKAVKNGKKSKSAIAKEFSVAESTVSSVVKNKQRIINASDTASLKPDQKRLRLAAHSDIEETLMMWFTQAQALNEEVAYKRGLRAHKMADMLAF